MVCIRAAFAFFSLPLSLLAAGQDMTVHVTYETVAIRASDAILDIAKLTHRDLGVDQKLGMQPIILRLNDVPLKDAMDQIAKVLHASWSQNKTQFTLMRSDEEEQALQQAAGKKRVDEMRKKFQRILRNRPDTPLDFDSAVALIKKMKDDRAAEIKMDTDWEQAHKGVQDFSKIPPSELQQMMEQMQATTKLRIADESQGANGRLLARVVAAIDPNVFASPYADHLVFSTDPKPFQVKLDISPEDFQALVDEQNVWTQAEKQVRSTTQDETESYAPRQMINPSDARLVVTPGTTSEGLPEDFQVYVLDSKGNQLVGLPETYGLGFGGLGMGMDMGLTGFSSFVYKDYSTLGLPRVKLSPLSSELCALTKGQTNGGFDLIRPASEPLHQFLLDSVSHDPLALVPSDVLLGAAEAKGWNLVASPPDAVMAHPWVESPVSVNSAEYLQELSTEGCDVEMPDGWLEVSPSDPVATEASRTDRASLGKMLGAVDKLGYASIDDMGTFAAMNGPDVTSDLISLYLSVCHPGMDPFDQFDFSALRLYGLLSEGQRQSLAQGGKMPMTSLSGDQQDALLHLLLTSNDLDIEPIVRDESEPGNADDSPGKVGAWIDQEENVIFQPLATNATEYLSRAPDPNIVLSGTVTTSQAIHLKTQGDDPMEVRGDAPQVVTTPSGTAFVTIESGDPDAFSTSYVSPQEVASMLVRKRKSASYEFACANERDIVMTITLTDKVEATVTLTEHDKDSGPLGPYDRLPEEIKQQIEDTEKQMQAANAADLGDASDSDGNPQPAPPPT